MGARAHDVWSISNIPQNERIPENWIGPSFRLTIRQPRDALPPVSPLQLGRSCGVPSQWKPDEIRLRLSLSQRKHVSRAMDDWVLCVQSLLWPAWETDLLGKVWEVSARAWLREGVCAVSVLHFGHYRCQYEVKCGPICDGLWLQQLWLLQLRQVSRLGHFEIPPDSLLWPPIQNFHHQNPLGSKCHQVNDHAIPAPENSGEIQFPRFWLERQTYWEFWGG